MAGKQFGVQGKRDGVNGAPRPPRRPLVLLPLAALALALVAPAGAGANVSGSRFVFEQCDSALPGGGVPVSSHSYSNAFAPFQNCASPGGSIGLVETEPVSGTFGALGISVPETPGGFVESETITAVQAGVDPSGPLHFSHVYENGFPGASSESTRLFQIRSEPAFFFGNGGAFEVVMSCDANVGPCGPGPVEAARWIAATEVDPNPPKLSSPSGSLLAGGLARGHQTLAAQATDVGGGVSNIAVLVNGKLAAAQPGACAVTTVANKSYVGTVALTTTPCPAALAGAWTFNTEAAPFVEGANTVQVCASDFSTLGSPSTACLPPQTVAVDNSCAPSTVAGGELLSAQFSRSNRETQTVHYGKEAEVIGQLHTNAGDPVANATLCLKAQTLGIGAPVKNGGTVQTDANGNYSFIIPPGPNRKVVIGYRYDTLQIAREVRYYSHVRPEFKAIPGELSNGERVHFWGRLPGPHRRGRVVVLQANVLGSKRWITFRKATSHRKGVFRASYHFTSTTRRTIYRFRAVIPVQRGYPWVHGRSKPVRVLVKR